MQSVSEAFTSATEALVRLVQTKLEVQWDGTNWTDESQYVRLHSGSTRFGQTSDELVAPGSIAGAEVLLDSSTNRFNWLRSDGPLYGYIGGDMGMYGIGARLYVGFGGEYCRIFTGVIVTWEEGRGDVRLTLRDEGYRYLQDKQSTVMYEQERTDSWVKRLCDWMGLPSGDQILDPGIFTIPYCWLDDESLIEEAWDVAAAEGGRCWIDALGKLHFENVVHWLDAVHQAVQWAFTEEDLVVTGPTSRTEDVATTVIAEWSARAVSGLAVVFTLQEEKVVAPGEALSFDARLNQPVLAYAALTAGTDYSVQSSGGQDLAASVVIELIPAQQFAQRCRIAITNNHTTLAAHVGFLQIRGYPLLGSPAEQVEIVADPPPLSFKRPRSVRGSPYLQTYAQAHALAAVLGARYQRLMRTWSLVGVAGVPQLELGDRVSFTDAKRISDLIEGFVTQIQWQFAPDAGYIQNLEVLGAEDYFPTTGYFIIGTTALGAVGKCWY